MRPVLSSVRRHRRLVFPIAAILAVAACGGDQAAPELTDPVEILQAAADTTATATSTHFRLSADGTLAISLTGGGPAAPIALTDTSAEGDLDLAGGDARVTFAIPAVLGLRGELLMVDGSAWAKTSVTGTDWVRLATGEDGGSIDPAASPGAAGMPPLAAAIEALAQPALAPVKGDDVDCGNERCYAVQVEISSDDLVTLVSAIVAGGIGDDGTGTGGTLPIPIPDLGASTWRTIVTVEKATRRLAGIAIASGADSAAGTAGLEVEILFSKWDASVSIEPPPPDEVGAAG